MAGERYEFDGFILDVDEEKLSRAGQSVSIQRKPLELLITLVRAGGQRVHRDTLRTSLWDGVHVTDASLAQAVRKARRALRTAGGSPDIILTETGVGYRLGVAAVPLAAPVETVGNLGADLSDMVGREDEQTRLLSWLQTERLVTLSGLGGIGKTTLALSVARRLSATLPGGSWLVEAEAVTTVDGLRTAIASALQIRLSGSPDARLCAALQARGHILLVLDNLEQVAAPGAAILGWLRAAPRLRILVTSRTRLQVRPERVLELGPLPVADGRALFARRSGVDDDDEALSTLIAAVDGIPLAVELLAAQRMLMGVSDLTASVRESLVTLPNINRDAPARHATLHTTLDWSWSLLSPPARAALVDLGVFTHSFSMKRAMTVVGPAGALQVAHLRQGSLVALGDDGLLRLPVPVREYAGEKLLKTERHHAVRSRLLASLVAATADYRRQSLTHLARLRSDLWSILTHPDEDDAVLDCIAALLYLEGFGVGAERLRPVRERLTRITERCSGDTAGRAWAKLARLAQTRRQPDEATRCLTAALETAPEHGEVLLAGAAIAGRSGQADVGIARARKARAWFQARGDRISAARAQGSEATTMVIHGQDEAAVPLLQEAVATLRSCSAEAAAMPFALNLAIALGNLGRAEERAVMLGTLDEMLLISPDPYFRAVVDAERGRSAAGQGALRVAERLLLEAGEKLRQMGASSWYPDWVVAVVCARQGRPDAARRHLAAAEAGAAGAGAAAQADVHRAQTIIAHLLGDNAWSLRAALETVAIFDAQHNPSGAAELRCWAAMAHLRMGDAAAALATLAPIRPDDTTANAVALIELLRRCAAGEPITAADRAAAAAALIDEDRLLIDALSQ